MNKFQKNFKWIVLTVVCAMTCGTALYLTKGNSSVETVTIPMSRLRQLKVDSLLLQLKIKENKRLLAQQSAKKEDEKPVETEADKQLKKALAKEVALHKELPDFLEASSYIEGNYAVLRLKPRKHDMLTYDYLPETEQIINTYMNADELLTACDKADKGLIIEYVGAGKKDIMRFVIMREWLLMNG